jgi:hypothetical protein
MTDYSKIDSHRIEDKVPGKIMKQPEGTFKRLVESKKAAARENSSSMTRGSFSTLPPAVGTKDMK